MSSRSLPAIPNLEQQKKLARQLLDAARAGEPDALARFRAHHPRLRVTALHLAAQSGQRAMVEVLVGRGADPTIQDAIYKSTPAGWASHFGAHEVAAYLRDVARH